MGTALSKRRLSVEDRPCYLKHRLQAVLANFDEGELKEIIEKNHCGVFTKADDLEGFVNAIEELSKHPERCAEMGKNGRQFILENLTREVGTRKYVEVIKSVVNVNGR